MGGVDRNDQMRSYYAIPVSGKKWWTRIFFDLIDRAIYNSFVLEQESPNQNKRSLKDFRLELAKKLVGDFCSRRKRCRVSEEGQLGRHVEKHFPDFLPLNDKGRRKERTCKVCADKGISKKTSYFCPDCNVVLCVAPCFRKFHTA